MCPRCGPRPGDGGQADRAAGGVEVFRQLVLARIIEPTSKADSLRVLCEVGSGRRSCMDIRISPSKIEVHCRF